MTILRKRKRDLWLVFYGVFVALFIQVFIDFFGVFGGIWTTIIGLIISVSGIIALGFYAINGLSWKKNVNNEIDEEKEFRQRAIEEFDRNTCLFHALT